MTMYFSKVNDPSVWESEHYFIFAKSGQANAAEEFLNGVDKLVAFAENACCDDTKHYEGFSDKCRRCIVLKEWHKA